MKIKLENVEQVNGGSCLRANSILAKYWNENHVKEHKVGNITVRVYPDGGSYCTATY